MSAPLAQAPPKARSTSVDALAEAEPIQLPALPTFPLDVGYREVFNPNTGNYDQQPLTLLDILFPSEDDVDVVKMAESPTHDLWTTLLATLLRMYLGARGWLILRDVLVHWGRRNAPPKGPDIAAIQGGRFPPEGQKFYRVGRDGGLPSFVIEVTFDETLSVDLDDKRIFYAAMGVKEMLIMDLLTPAPTPWRLIGYRLENQPHYTELTADADGGLTFETVGLRFVGVERERVDVFEVATGERLLSPDEWRARAEAEAMRADAEANARAAAEAHAAEMERRLRALEARYGAQADQDNP